MFLDIVLVSAMVLLLVAVAMTITAVVARRLNRASVVDVTWGLAFVVSAIACAVVGPAISDAEAWRAWLLALLVTLWGVRLSWHIATKQRGHGEDPRYRKLLGGELDDGHFGDAVRQVFVIQGLAVWLVSLPVQVASVVDVGWSWLVWVGVAVWAIGVVFESVGDAQLAAYKAQPRDQRSPVLDSGLWRYTRHPNYFGDACVWWGLWLAGAVASGWLPAIATFVAPFAMTYFLAYATGARLLEQTMMERPAYREYASRTSMFVPWVPRR